MSSAVDDFMAQGMDDEDLEVLGAEAGWLMAGTGAAVSSAALDDLAAPSAPSATSVGSGATGSAGAETGGSWDGVMAALDQEGAGVFAWRSATRERIAEQWSELREFVCWVVDVYRFESAEHKPCWWQHPDVVQEWVSLRHLHVLSWSAEDSGAGPNNFHYWLVAARARMRSQWQKASGCTAAGQHQAVREGVLGTVMTDEQWAELTGSSDAFTMAASWPRWEGETA